jgi:hypothetical protein
MGASDLTGGLFEGLSSGPAHRFGDYLSLAADVPRTPGVYTIWDGPILVYVGVAGRNPIGGQGLAGRLRSHASGRRSGDQFCVYVADHYVLPTLNREQVEAIRDGRLSFDALVRDRVGSMVFRFVQAEDYAAALALERAVKRGALPAGRPRLNPTPWRAHSLPGGPQ